MSLQAVVALKGATTYIVSPQGEAWFFDEGNVGLATSGSGDTLAGIIVGLLARGAERRLTPQCGVSVSTAKPARACLTSTGMSASSLTTPRYLGRFRASWPTSPLFATRPGEAPWRFSSAAATPASAPRGFSISAASSIDWNASVVLVEGVKIIEKWTFRFIASQPAGTHKRVVVSLMAGGHLLLASVLFVNAAKT